MKTTFSYDIVQKLLVLLLLTMPVACQHGDVAVETSPILASLPFDTVDVDLDKIKKRGSLRAVLNRSSTGYFIYRGQPMGYEYELLTRFARSLDVELDIVMSHGIDDAFRLLEQGEGDLIAFNMTVTAARRERVAFTNHHSLVRQVLVQRQPNQWRRIKRHRLEEIMIRNPLELEGKEIHVPQGSAFAERLAHLSAEIGGEIQIVEERMSPEQLIKMVADGEIDYTIADENQARVNTAYYPLIDVETPISFPQKVAWATRPEAEMLLSAVNSWMVKMKRGPEYNMIYRKYFHSPKTMLRRVRSEYSSVGGEFISPYDPQLRQHASTLGWDWRLLAAQVYQESKFDPEAKSWAGAEGLMQLLPSTGEMYGVTDMVNPTQSLRAGTAYLAWLDALWIKYVPDQEERIKFVLASYNAGQGHVLDARRLAIKHERNPESWEDVAEFLLLKSEAAYYTDPVVKSGYCRGSEPVNYVHEILQRYDTYYQLMPEGTMIASAAHTLTNS